MQGNSIRLLRVLNRAFSSCNTYSNHSFFPTHLIISDMQSALALTHVPPAHMLYLKHVVCLNAKAKVYGQQPFFFAPDYLEPNLPRRQMSSMTVTIFLRGEGIMQCVSHFSDGGSTIQIRQGDGARQTTSSPPFSCLKAPVRGLKLPAPLAAPLLKKKS